jgi:hypothetical protein
MPTASSRTVVLLANTTFAAAATTNGSTIVVPEGFKSARIRISTDAGAGTSPTLDIYIQNGFTKPATTDLVGNDCSGAIEWNDVIHFTQVTTAASVQYCGFYPVSNFQNAAQDGALTAANTRNGPMGVRLRVKVVVGGTSPTFPNVNVAAEFLPW